MAHWIASLSNGNRISEERLQYDSRTGFYNLKKDILKDGVFVTQVQLVVKGHRFNSPAIRNKPKENESIIKDFFICRKASMEFYGSAGSQSDFLAFSYIIQDNRHYLWVNEDTLEVKVEVKPVDEEYEKDIFKVI